MAIEVVTSDYLLSHGRQPRGRGTWAFSFDGPNVDSIDPRILWTPAASYAEAKKLARAEAAKRGACRIWVLS